ncbi:MAG: hypothetical protein IJD21_05375 [Oscillospiraceae bacterium]|nr:hypothetical protein [Oscillospiraceae bacterium]
MRKRGWNWLMLIMAVLLLLPVEARADIGPKPSVSVCFEAMGGETCYATLLSKTESTGPYSAWDGVEEYVVDDGLPEEVWAAFAAYEDPDGFYFLQCAWLVSQSHELVWSYYPPQEFKILLYYPDTGTFVTSEAYERYAFDSYFTVNVFGVEPQEPGLMPLLILARKSYDMTWELISLCARVALTILVECGLALLFGFREKGQFRVIFVVNVVTQIVLNVLLNLVNYSQGALSFLLCYLLFELIVFVLEAAVFSVLLPRAGGKEVSVRKCVLYALLANILSYWTGYMVAVWVPGIF